LVPVLGVHRAQVAVFDLLDRFDVGGGGIGGINRAHRVIATHRVCRGASRARIERDLSSLAAIPFR
ncbi:MAG: hypothetical protein QOG37_717, partial [Mycobacterium sp.]|nr:hypothetical protein [Mycobacterium sp.]